MPIQFRCQNCSQLLGISRSKAGSVVDCPACGRSLRVPNADGAAEPEPVQRSASDSSLLSALEELSNLPTSPGVEKAVTPAPQRTPPGSVKTEASAEKDAMRIVPLSATSATSRAPSSEDVFRDPDEIFSGQDSAPLIIPEMCDLEVTDQPDVSEELWTAQPAAAEAESETPFHLPHHLSTALDELAGHAPQTAASESRLAERHSRARLWVTLVALTALISFSAGYLVARSQEASQANGALEINELAPANPIPPAIHNEAAPIQPISGSVVFSDAGGVSKPDAGALILLVPSANTSGLKLDARPLRDLQKSPAKEAVEVALNVLGATITRAANDGTFTLNRRHSGPAKLIVVSRHSSRTDGETIQPSVVSSLADWFESPSHLTGRLSVQEKALPAETNGTSGPSIEVHFGK